MDRPVTGGGQGGDTLNRDYFDRLYEKDPDPWRFRARPYEARKRALTLASLPEDHYEDVFEPGCSFGLLSTGLAARSTRVLAMDLSALALRQAAAEVPSNVELRLGAVPADWPCGHFDLVLLSEIGYYLDEPDCSRLAELCTANGGDLVLVHWRHPVADYPLRGDDVHRIIGGAAARAGMSHLIAHCEEDLLLDVWSSDGRSVAARTGLVDP